MNETLTLDPDVLRQTLLNKLSQQAVQLVQQEAAIAQLLDENAELKAQIPQDEREADAVHNT